MLGAKGGCLLLDTRYWMLDAQRTVDGQPISGTYTICHSTLRTPHSQFHICHLPLANSCSKLFPGHLNEYAQILVNFVKQEFCCLSASLNPDFVWHLVFAR